MLKPIFGAAVNPATTDPHQPIEMAKTADQNGFDLISSMDHPYNATHLDAWTMLSMLAGVTKNVHLMTDVANVPLRQPAMLAKQSATLDFLSGGRVVLGIGAGAIWPAVKAFGGPDNAAKPFTAFREAVDIITGLWENAGTSFTYEGEIYSVKGAKFGPAPTRQIPIWVGGRGPKMLNLIGQRADGIIVSNFKDTPDKLLYYSKGVDEGAAEAGRSPEDIRRGYNLGGVLTPEHVDKASEGGFVGSTEQWVEHIVDLAKNYRQNAFVFWPGGDNAAEQIEQFGKEVIPAVKSELGF